MRIHQNFDKIKRSNFVAPFSHFFEGMLFLPPPDGLPVVDGIFGAPFPPHVFAIVFYLLILFYRSKIHFDFINQIKRTEKSVIN